MGHRHVRITLTISAALHDMVYKWSIYLAFSLWTFGDIMLTIGMCELLYIRTTVFAE